MIKLFDNKMLLKKFHILGFFLQLLSFAWSLSSIKFKPTETYCYSTANHDFQREHYTLETPYPSINDNDFHKIDGCEPEKIWIVSRHGTRYPSAHKIDTLEEKLPHIRKEIHKNPKLCQADYDLIFQWKPNATNERPCGLAWPQGWTDLHQVARTYKSKFPTIFNAPYSPKTYSFTHSSAYRTEQSCEAFTEQLFGKKTMNSSMKHWTIDDQMLRPWSLCRDFHKYLHSLGDYETQMDRFMSSPYYQGVRKSVSERLGMKRITGHTDLGEMWDQCRYQQAFYLNQSSPWCAAFDLNEAIILEYLGDMDLYYKYSYGSEWSKKLPCTVVKSMVDTMINPDASTKVTALFTHAELLTMLITALNAKQDAKPLLASNFEQQKNRLFRSSKWVPYGSSLAAIKYNCALNGSSSSFSSSANANGFSSSYASGKPLVSLLLNQEPLTVPWCKLGHLCEIDEISRFFKNSEMRNCPYDICGPEFATSKNAVMKYTC